MPFSALALSETHFFLVNTSITCTRGLAVIHQASRTNIFAIASIRTYVRFIHYIAIRKYWCWPRSELSLVENRPHTEAHALTRTYSGTPKTSPLCSFNTLSERNNDSDNTTQTTILSISLHTLSHRTSRSRPRTNLDYPPTPTTPTSRNPGNQNHDVLFPAQKALRSPNSPPPSLPRHRLRAHLRAPRRHRRQVHRAAFGLLPKSAYSAGGVAPCACGSRSPGRDVRQV